ncbi:MAG: hypothetical protein AAFP19_19285, partial [Bacteroidota bacterium]
MKRTLLFSLIYLCAFSLFAQAPINDNCADAIPVGRDSTVDFSTITASTDGPFHVDSPCPSAENDTIWNDIWYLFTPDFT